MMVSKAVRKLNLTALQETEHSGGRMDSKQSTMSVIQHTFLDWLELALITIIHLLSDLCASVYVIICECLVTLI